MQEVSGAAVGFLREIAREGGVSLDILTSGLDVEPSDHHVAESVEQERHRDEHGVGQRGEPAHREVDEEEEPETKKSKESAGFFKGANVSTVSGYAKGAPKENKDIAKRNKNKSKGKGKKK